MIALFNPRKNNKNNVLNILRVWSVEHADTVYQDCYIKSNNLIRLSFPYFSNKKLMSFKVLCNSNITANKNNS